MSDYAATLQKGGTFVYTKKITILNQTGLHARPASIFVSKANSFQSDITINKLDENGVVIKSCPAKSIVLLLTLALSKGTRVELSADGTDEKQAVEALADLIEGDSLE